MQARFKRVIQLELNEVSEAILKPAYEKGLLPNFASMNQRWQHTQTTSESKFELLEPWIQWVTVHTGKTFQDHKIFHLGDACQLTCEQIWETLSDRNIESAIIGSMNGHRGKAQGGVFFPDPWMPNGQAHPQKLQPLWNFISRRVQSHATSSGDSLQSFRNFEALFNLRIPVGLYARIGKQILTQKFEKSKSWKLAALFDEFLFAIFDNVLSETNFGFYTLFLNSIAHYQHHYWRQYQPDLFNPEIVCPDCGPHDNPIEFGLHVYDRIIGKVMHKYGKDPDTLVVVLTGLSQVPYLKHEELGGMHYYRLRDHKRFLQVLELDNIDVWPLMSRDWQISSSNSAALENAYRVLSQLTVKGLKLFSISRNSPESYFIETSVTDGTIYDTPIFQGNGKPAGMFKDWFKSIAIKSGYHNGTGSLWVSQPVLRAEQIPSMPLTDVFHLGVDALNG
jgi:hypothetical protein